jgi:phasin family protein
MVDRIAPETAFFDAYRTAFAPVIAAQQEGLKALSRIAHYQYAVAGDVLELSLAHAKTSLSAKSAPEFVSQQTEFSTRLGEQLQKRSQELLKIATESQAAMTQLFADGAIKAAEATKKAA